MAADQQVTGGPGGTSGPLDDVLAARMELAFGADAAAEFDALPTDDEEDDHLLALVERVTAGDGRENLPALSALSRQLSHYRPLTAQEQAPLLATYREGLAAVAQLNAGVNSRDLQVAARRGHSAQTELVGSMFRLALAICREQAGRRYGRERMLEMLPDLVSEANIAVVEALATFDPARGPAFSMYAGRVMRDRVRAVLQDSAVTGKAPPAWLRIKRGYAVLVPELESQLGRRPTEEEVKEALRAWCMSWARGRLTAEQATLPPDEQIAIMEGKLRKQGMFAAINRLADVLAATAAESYLDAPVGDSDGSRLGDLIDRGSTGEEFAQVEIAELRQALIAALSGLTEREREIIWFKYGFADGEQWTYAKLAPKFGVSAERIRQIDRAVLSKLRGPEFGHLAAHLPSHTE